VNRLLRRGVPAALLLPLLSLPAAQAAPTPPVAARASDAVTTAYACTSDFGSGAAAARVATALPRSVAAGRTLARRDLTVALRVPQQLVDRLRAFGVDSLSGSARPTTVRAGRTRVRVTGLRIPRTPVPASGAMTLRGSGDLAAFSVPTPGRYAVRVPRRVVADVVARIGETPASTTLLCAVASGAPQRLTTLSVRG
jgi:hypothetical protein